MSKSRRRAQAVIEPVKPRALAKPEAAAYLGCGTTTLDKLIADGIVTVIRYPGVRKDFFDRLQLDRVIERSVKISENSTTTLPLLEDKYGLLRVARGGKVPVSG